MTMLDVNLQSRLKTWYVQLGQLFGYLCTDLYHLNHLINIIPSQKYICVICK